MSVYFVTVTGAVTNAYTNIPKMAHSKKSFVLLTAWVTEKLERLIGLGPKRDLLSCLTLHTHIKVRLGRSEDIVTHEA